jgi:hypothetical protein
MGGFSSQVQAPQTSQPQGGGGKIGNMASQVADQASQQSPQPLDGVQNGYAPRPMGKGGRQTNSATSGQPTMGAPNQYSNTVGQWDNTQIQPVSHGKGKGG